jgi:hypothetical protein
MNATTEATKHLDQKTPTVRLLPTLVVSIGIPVLLSTGSVLVVNWSVHFIKGKQERLKVFQLVGDQEGGNHFSKVKLQSKLRDVILRPQVLTFAGGVSVTPHPCAAGEPPRTSN